MQVVFTLFGRCQLLIDGVAVKFSTEHSRALLAYLAMQPGAHERTTLAALLWSERPEATARQNLRQTLFHLKQSLGTFPQPGASLTVTTRSIELQAGTLATDAQLFSQLLATCAAHTHPQLVSCEECMARLQEAAQLYTGEFLHGVYIKNSLLLDEWILFLREQFHRQIMEILDTLTRHAEVVADYSQMQRHASRQLTLEPWCEEAHRQLMRALALKGQSTAALAHYAICQRTLVEELGIPPSQATTALYEQIKRGDFDGAMRPLGDEELKTQEPRERSQGDATKSRRPAPHNLPSPLTPFIGREHEVNDIVQQVADPQTRLLTLVGLGGIGKTRLAIEAALKFYTLHMTQSPANSSVRDGLFFVSLAPLSSSAALAPTIAATFGLDLGRDPQQAVINYLRNKAVLLILDNFEHLLDGVPFVIELLEQAPHVQILATSRERLNARGEQLFPVPSLTHETQGELAEATTWSAVRLFVERARRVSPNFKVIASNLPAMLRICGLVQGMPLGLEMAAAWCGALSLDEIAAEIARGIDFLTVDYADLPERQRSIRTVFAWSWQQLNDAQRLTLRRIALFRGGFTLHAAQTVAGATLPILIRLIHKSLLQWQENPAGGGRYTMHELLRQFAAEQLNAVEYAIVAEQHSNYYLAFVAAWGLRLGRGEPKEASTEIQTELDNVRQAWLWAIRGGQVLALDQACYGWWQFCLFRGLEAEGRTTFALAVESLRQRLPALSNDPDARQQAERVLSKFLALYANYLFGLSQWETMAALAQEAITLGQASGGVEGEAFGYFVLGRAFQELERAPEAKVMFEKTIETARRQPQDSQSELLFEVEWMGYSWLKGSMQAIGDYQGARECIVQALEVCRSRGKLRGELACLINLALNSFMRGDYATAAQEYERALPHFLILGAPILEGSVQNEYGEILRLQGKYLQAKARLENAIVILRANAAYYEEAWTLTSLLHVQCQLGDRESAGAWRSELQHLLNDQELTQGCRAQALMAFALHSLLGGDHYQALDEAEQAWRIAERVSIPSNRADAAVVLGHTHAGMEEWAVATRCYQQAVAIYLQVGNAALAVEAQAGLAQCALAQGNRTEAQQLVETMLPMLNEHTCAGCNTPYYIWLTCYQVLAANQDARAAAILQRGHDLLQQYARSITDNGLRHSFLEEVRPHRTLQQAYAELLAHR